MVKKHKTQHHSQSAHHVHSAASPKREMVATIIMTVVITAAILIAGFLIFNALKDHNWSKPSTGSGSGKVTMIEYSDFQCPFCGRVYPTLKQLEAQYGDKLEIVFKHFPLSFHPFAQKAAEASECARDQDQFSAYHDVLFTHQDKLAVSDLKQYASDLKLDTGKFNTCLDTGAKTAIVAADQAEGQRLGVSGTPTFFINGESIVGAQPITAFQTAIDKALGNGGSATGSTTPTPSANDPIVTLTVITDATCKSCDSKQIIDVTKQQLFPTAQIVTIDKDDSAAQKLIADLKLTALPAYLFSSNIKDAASFSKVSGAMDLIGDYYVIKPGAAGPVRYTVLPSIDGKEVLGLADAPVTIVEFSDFQCPYCKKFADDVFPTLDAKYIKTGKAKIVYMEFPLDQIHPFAHGAALAAECAGEQNKFWVYHDELFKDQSTLGISDLKEKAKAIGLDTEQFNTCLDTQRYESLISADKATADGYGISGTPAFLVNGVFVGGLLPVEAFTQIIDDELAAASN